MYIRQRYFQITDTNGVPSFGFDGRYTSSSIADFLLGIPSSEAAALGDSAQNLNSNFIAGYFQDEYKVTRALTLNLGLRYEYSTPPTDATGRMQYFNESTGQIVVTNKTPIRADRNNFAPRIGFAYQSPLAGIVIRGGGGIFYSTDNWNELQFLVL